MFKFFDSISLKIMETMLPCTPGSFTFWRQGPWSVYSLFPNGNNTRMEEASQFLFVAICRILFFFSKNSTQASVPCLLDGIEAGYRLTGEFSQGSLRTGHQTKSSYRSTGQHHPQPSFTVI